MSLSTELVELKKEFNVLKSTNEILVQRLSAFGISLDRWLTPYKASQLLGISRTVIMGEIRKAEYARITKQKYDLKYGKHYRQVESHWQISDREFAQIYLETPPDQRPAIDVPDEFKLSD